MLLLALVLLPLKTLLFAQWLNEIVKAEDEITGKNYFSVMTQPIMPTTEMAYPYDETIIMSNFIIACLQDGTEAVYIALYSIPNDETNTDITIEGRRIEDHKIIETQGKWDDTIQDIILIEYPQFTGSWLAFFDTQNAIANIQNSKQFLLKISLYKYGYIYFKHSITGGREKLSELRKKCGY